VNIINDLKFKEDIFVPSKDKSILSHIHIPRTGGQYISYYKKKTYPTVDNIFHLGHIYIVETLELFTKNPIFPNNVYIGLHGILPVEMLGGSYPFATIRNIFDLLVSIYEYWKKDDTTFREWLIETTQRIEECWPNSKFLFTQLFTDRGSWVCDWICRTETLDEDLEAMGKYYGLKYTHRNKLNTSSRKDYREYYTDDLVDLVYETWGREIELYGYSFDKIECCPNNKFRQKIDGKLKLKHKYVYSTDNLYEAKYDMGRV